MIDVKFDQREVDIILSRLASLQTNFAKNAMRRSMRKGLKPIQKQAIANAMRFDDPKSLEMIWKNIVIHSGKIRDKDKLKMRVGVLGGARSQSKDAIKSRNRRARKGIPSLASLGEMEGRGKGNPGGDTWYWRFLEFGTSKMGARPFMRPAMLSKKDEVFSTITKLMREELDKEVKKRL